MKLSSEQTRLFWRTFKRACEVHCVPKAEERTFRQGLIFDAIEKTSLTQVKPGREFDAVMLALARLAGDLELVDHFNQAALWRLAYLAEKNIGELLCRRDHVSYVRPFYVRSYLASMLERRNGTRFNPDRERWWTTVSEADLEFLMRASAIALKRAQAQNTPAATSN